ncbi:oxidoreductase [Spongorhabdus nitratireducens]
MLCKKWTAADMPDLSGKVAIVTGANTGLGYKTSLELARKGAHVVMTARNINKGQQAIEQIQTQFPGAKLCLLQLDLTDTNTIATFAAELSNRFSSLDLLICNGGVVNLETRMQTSRGYEMHFATNHLGHFALTQALLPLLDKAEKARVVVVSSGGYAFGDLDFDDLHWQHRPYNRVKVYGTSKLANLLFVHQLNKQLANSNSSTIAVSAHPGLTASERQQAEGVGGCLSKWLASPLDTGVKPQLYAATAPDVKAGQYYGPRFGLRGSPAAKSLKPVATDDTAAKRLWQISTALLQ